MRPLIVECFGLPGAGKTTVVEGAMVALNKQGLKVFGGSEYSHLVRAMSTFDKVQLVSGRPELTSSLFELSRYLLSVRPWSSWKTKQVAKLLLDESYIEKAASELSCDALILDQATVQRVWSVAAMSKLGFRSFERVLTWLVRQRSTPTVFVYFDVSVEDAATRIVKRAHGESRFDGRKLEELVSLLVGEHPRLRYFRDSLSRQGFPVYQIGPRGTVSEKCKDLERIVLECLTVQGHEK